MINWFIVYDFFSIRVFFTDADDSQDSRGREGTIFYSILPLPPVHEHWDIYFQLCMWHVRSLSRIFNRNGCVSQTATRWDLPPYRITIFTYIYTYINMYIYVYIYIYVCTYVYTAYIYIYINFAYLSMKMSNQNSFKKIILRFLQYIHIFIYIPKFTYTYI